MTDAARDVVVVGEALVDIVRTSAGAAESPGGSPANVAVALGRLERSTMLVTSLADDTHGHAVRSWVESSGVELRVASRPVRTSSADALIDASGDASYRFDIEWALSAPIDVPEAQVVHTGSIASYVNPGAAVVAAAIERARPHAIVTFDPNVRPALADDFGRVRACIERIVRAADVVKASDEDLAWLYPSLSLDDAARRWLAMGPPLVVVTHGAAGAFAAHADVGVVGVPGQRVDVVDTVGAGDTFMGALIDAILDVRAPDAAARRTAIAALTREDLERMLRRCVAASAITVSRVGMNPPRRVELDAGLLDVKESD